MAPKVKKAKSKKTTDADDVEVKTIIEPESSSTPVKADIKISPCDARKYLEVYGGCLVHIPMTDEERKIFCPNWNSVTNPAWELFVKDYEQPPEDVKNKD